MTTTDETPEIRVLPFTRVQEDGEVIIGRPSTGTFLVVERTAVEVLDWIAEGASVRDAGIRYFDRYGERIDLDSFLEQLASKGFVRIGHEASDFDEPHGAERRADPRERRFHLEWISPEIARRVWNPRLWTVLGLVIAAGLAALVARPELLPSWRALYFPHGFGLFGSVLALSGLLVIAVHEMAHFIAARAVGVSCRFGFGTRLWVPVAETDMTGIWAVPRRRRYLPFLAGPIVDATGAALCILVKLAAASGWITLPLGGLRFVDGLLLIYLLGLLWQCYFFVRTDFYYVLANLLRCKNLMEDTSVFVRNLVAPAVPGLERRDQSHLPRHERRALRGFAVAWIAGRVVALGALVWIQLPLAWSYLTLLGGALVQSDGPTRSAGTLFTAFLAVATLALGLTLWLRRLYRRR